MTQTMLPAKGDTADPIITWIQMVNRLGQQIDELAAIEGLFNNIHQPASRKLQGLQDLWQFLAAHGPGTPLADGEHVPEGWREALAKQGFTPDWQPIQPQRAERPCHP